MKNVQMKLKAFKFLTIAVFVATGSLVSCVSDSNSPGLEYMPDMYRSPSVEGQVDYGEVRGIYSDSARNMVAEKFSFLAPMGTIPYAANGEMYLAPYRHGAPIGEDRTHGLFEVRQDSAGLTNAKNDINPLAYTEANANEGKVLYERFCIHCHGEKGDGQGTAVLNSNGKFPGPQAYKKEMTPGEMYYIITYGRNQMGAHASQVSPVERWKIVHYIEKLAGKDKEFEPELLFDAHKDTDGDGVMDSQDEVPTVKGLKENNGAPAVSPETKSVQDFADANVVFVSGSATLSPASSESLDRLVALLLANESFNLVVNGHTDNTGDAMFNKALSYSRAQAVKAYLVEKGIDKGRITAYGYGQNKPKADNSSEEGRLANRRVEFRIF